VNEHEQAFVQEFVLSQRRNRYIHLLSSAKKRRTFRNRMAHALVGDLDSRFLYDEDALPDDAKKRIDRLLNQFGRSSAPCHTMCEVEMLDGQDLTLGEAEAKWDFLSGLIISVVPGKLIYYRPERPNKNYVLLKD
jgi:hypothetical protein